MTYRIKPSIAKLSEEEVRTALNSRDEDNLIVVEFGLLLHALMAECRQIMKDGGNVQELLDRKPSCAMEMVALELLRDMAVTLRGT
jgi:hypothetical protein